MDNIIIREIQEADLENGFLQSLDNLKKASDLQNNIAKNILNEILDDSNHIIHIAELDGKIVGSSTMFIEQKFIHEGGLVGHIEDVVVRKGFERKQIGQKIIESLLLVAKNRGCYKTILDCKDDVKEFYEKIGFKHESNGMRFNY
ncbi:MAG: histone acetyltransferase [Thaumarchaeota archaeon]|nr:histone acetyltransferase [Nitrososphaerota archaeon]|tara:strand:- start:3362 stop:3796 length:435 start_codon:yes stop_codon:yes gene_type:complete